MLISSPSRAFGPEADGVGFGEGGIFDLKQLFAV